MVEEKGGPKSADIIHGGSLAEKESDGCFFGGAICVLYCRARVELKMAANMSLDPLSYGPCKQDLFYIVIVHKFQNTSCIMYFPVSLSRVLLSGCPGLLSLPLFSSHEWILGRKGQRGSKDSEE